MLRTYIFNESKSNWTEEDKRLLLHDVCIFLDEINRKMYIWSGPKSSKKKFKKAYELAGEILSNYSDLKLQLIVLKKDIPLYIEDKLHSMLETAKEEEKKTYLFSRLSTIRFYFFFLLGVIIIPIIAFMNLSQSLLWPISNGNYVVSSTTYEVWIDTSKVLMIITLILFLLNLIMGIIERESQVITFSTIGLIVSAGIVIYLNFDIYLFLFQKGSTITSYLISRRDLIFFLFQNLIVVLILEIPHIYKFIIFVKTYQKFII